MNERSELIEWIRGELVGPSRPLTEPLVIEFVNREFVDPVPLRQGPIAWRPAQDLDLQEVLYFMRQTPHRKYGTGLLHPETAPATIPSEDQAAAQATDTIGAEPSGDIEPDESAERIGIDADERDAPGGTDDTDDFEVTSVDIRHPSTIGISFCARLDANGEVIIQLPQSRRFIWQNENSPPFALNGRYESCRRRWTDIDGHERDTPVWRRLSAVLPDTQVVISRSELISRQVIRKTVETPDGSPLVLRVDRCWRTCPPRIRHSWSASRFSRPSTRTFVLP